MRRFWASSICLAAAFTCAITPAIFCRVAAVRNVVRRRRVSPVLSTSRRGASHKRRFSAAVRHVPVWSRGTPRRRTIKTRCIASRVKGRAINVPFIRSTITICVFAAAWLRRQTYVLRPAVVTNIAAAPQEMVLAAVGRDAASVTGPRRGCRVSLTSAARCGGATRNRAGRVSGTPDLASHSAASSSCVLARRCCFSTIRSRRF